MESPFDALTPEAIALLRRHNLLRRLVERVVVDEAVGDAPLEPELKERSRQQFLRSNGIGDPQALARFLRDNGLDAADLEHQIELPLRIRRHAEERFRPKAEARFLDRKNQLDRVVYSLLRVKDRLLARELYLRIAAGEATFPELAAQHAEGPERSTNGIVGPAPLTQAHPLLAERLRTSTPGTLQEPFQVGEWWLVVRLENYTPASFDDAVAMQMAAELFGEWVQEETSRKVADLCGSASPATAATPA